MSSKYVLLSRLPLKIDPSEKDFYSLKNSGSTRYYFCEEQGVNELLELRGFQDIKEISLVEEEMESMFYRLSDHLSADIRRELLKFVESPINSKKELLKQIIFNFATWKFPRKVIRNIGFGETKPFLIL